MGDVNGSDLTGAINAIELVLIGFGGSNGRPTSCNDVRLPAVGELRSEIERGVKLNEADDADVEDGGRDGVSRGDDEEERRNRWPDGGNSAGLASVAIGECVAC